MGKYNEENDLLLAEELAKSHKLKIDMTYTEYVIVNILNKLQIGQVFNFKSNAELIKSLFGLNYENWLNDTFELSDKITLWLIFINKNERRNSYYFDGEYLVEYYRSDLTRKIKPIRVLFEIDDEDSNNKKYIYHGLYTLEESRTTTEKRYFKPIELEAQK